MALRNYPDLQPHFILDVRLTGKAIGKGSYGEVLEATIPSCDGFCAVKKLHPILETQVAGWINETMAAESRAQFVQECKMMSRLNHPHIVQFLGVCELPDSKTPALVTELMHTTLHSMLIPANAEPTSTTTVPRGYKHSILRDMARRLYTFPALAIATRYPSRPHCH